MTALPTLRRKILRAFSLIIFLYAILGALLVGAVFLSSNTTPKMIHLNYDSIAASSQMREAWNALDRPERYAHKTPSEFKKQFEDALVFEEGNITEPTEGETAQELRKHWNIDRIGAFPVAGSEFKTVNLLLDQIVQVNEVGMFNLAQKNSHTSDMLLFGGGIYFLITLALSLLLADGLANRLSKPLKSIAEALHRRPAIGSRLKLIEPDNLELLILSNELKRLWEKIIETDKVNVRELVEQKTKLETVLGSVEDGLLVLDEAGKVSHCNDCIFELIGLPRNQVQDRLWRDLPTAQENYIKLRALIREDMPESQELELKYKESMHQFSGRSRAMTGANGLRIGTLFLLHDITEKRQREKFRAEFIDLLSHELKTPLQSLGTASEFISSRKNQFPEELIPFVETIAEDVERIRAVANEFVQVTQSHSKIMKLKLSTVSLNQVLPEWIKPFKIVAKDRDVKLGFYTEGSGIIKASLDIVKFPWVISNLISNAIRFSPAGEEVQVLLTDRNGFVEIKVKDHGPGISVEDQRRIFEPFFQSVMVTSSGKQGLFGIGLTIAKEVVEAHEGRIEYYLLQPQGSEFRILLPFPNGEI